MHLINGNTEGIKQNILDELELLYELECPRSEFLTLEMAEALAKYSCLLNREISISLSQRARDGCLFGKRKPCSHAGGAQAARATGEVHDLS